MFRAEVAIGCATRTDAETAIARTIDPGIDKHSAFAVCRQDYAGATPLALRFGMKRPETLR